MSFNLFKKKETKIDIKVHTNFDLYKAILAELVIIKESVGHKIDPFYSEKLSISIDLFERILSHQDDSLFNKYLNSACEIIRKYSQFWK